MSYDEDDPGVGYNPAQRPHRHPAGRTCALRIGVVLALVWLSVGPRFRPWCYVHATWKVSCGCA